MFPPTGRSGDGGGRLLRDTAPTSADNPRLVTIRWPSGRSAPTPNSRLLSEPRQQVPTSQTLIGDFPDWCTVQGSDSRRFHGTRPLTKDHPSGR